MRRRCTFRGDDAPRCRAIRVDIALLTTLLLASCDYLTLPIPEDPGPPSVSVAGILPIVTDDRGSTATLTVALGSRPLADVQLTVATSDPSIATVEPALLSFTTAAWNTPQQVTVQGMIDSTRTGDRSYEIVFAPAVSADTRYSGYVAPRIAATALDLDVAGVVVETGGAIVTTEAGGTATFTVRLRSAPVSDVVVPVATSDAHEATVAPIELRFTPDDWSAPQTVQVTGVDDTAVDGDRAYQILLGPTQSESAAYDAVACDPVDARNLDDDVPPGITVAPTSGLFTTEAGGTATFTVVLATRPSADVSMVLYSSSIAEGTISPAAILFTPESWNVPVTVTVTGVDDAVPDGPQTYTIVTVPAESTDLVYDGWNAPDVTVTNLDND